MIGIYKIENTKNHKVYIGQSVDIEHRFNQHKNYLKNNKHSNSYLQRSWNKYGKENFNFSIVEICKNRKELNDKETYWFNCYLKTLGKNNVYNLGATGNAHNTSNKTRKRMKKVGKTKWDNFSEETKKRIMKNLSRGYWKGKKFSDEQKKKMSESLKGHPSWAKKHHSKETIEKMKSKAYLYKTKEYRENMSKIIKQKFKDHPEMSLKISKALKGRHTSPKTEFKKGHKYYKKEEKL